MLLDVFFLSFDAILLGHSKSWQLYKQAHNSECERLISERGEGDRNREDKPDLRLSADEIT